MGLIKDLSIESESSFHLSHELLLFCEEVGKAYIFEKVEFENVLAKIPNGLIKLICPTSEVPFFENRLKDRQKKIVSYEGKIDIQLARNPLKVRFKKEVRPEQKIKVLIVDDSTTVQKLLKSVICEDPSLEVVGFCSKPSEIQPAIEKFTPDIMTLDIYMPEMTGVEFLKSWPISKRIPTILISSLAKEEGPQVLEGLENGALDYVHKPSLDNLAEVGKVIIEKLKIFGRHRAIGPQTAKKVYSSEKFDSQKLVAIGSSTGGTEALRVLLTALPSQIPPILVVQHIPPVFSEAFALRLNSLCSFTVKEAKDGDEVLPNQVLIAPGGFQMEIKKSGQKWVVRVFPGEPVNRHRPSVDVLFDSVVKNYSHESVGVILTGMGADGAQGLLKMKKAGSHTIAQSEKTCVVFGMPKEAIKIGGAAEVLDLDEIPQKLFDGFKKRRVA